MIHNIMKNPVNSVYGLIDCRRNTRLNSASPITTNVNNHCAWLEPFEILFIENVILAHLIPKYRIDNNIKFAHFFAK